MNIPAWVEAIAGLVVTAATLADIFATILVPGQADRQLRIGALVSGATRPFARLSARWTRGPGQRPANSFPAFVFLLVFTAWMLLLLGGYALLFHSVRDQFRPLLDFGDAVWVTGCSLLTLGVSEFDADGVARWLILAAGLSGFAVITATISFILQIQSALHQREVRVLTLGSLAGTPPSGLHLLQAAAELKVTGELHDFFRVWRDWAAAVLHSHVSSPVLIFFHSVDRESDWLSALEAMLDAATLLMALTEDEAKGTATLMHRAGSRTAARLAAVLKVKENEAAALDEAAVRELAGSLRAAGYDTAEPDQSHVATLNRLRADYAGRIAGLAALIGAERTRPLD